MPCGGGLGGYPPNTLPLGGWGDGGGGLGGYEDGGGWGLWTHVWDPIPLPCAGPYQLEVEWGSPLPGCAPAWGGGGVMGRLPLQFKF